MHPSPQTDIDECKSTNKCSPLATCTNIPGNYTCNCATGYRSPDGRKCEGGCTRLLWMAVGSGVKGVCVGGVCYSR